MEVAREDGRKMMNACYRCRYRRDIPGDAHSRCAHPEVNSNDTLGRMMAVFASVGRGGPAVDLAGVRKLRIEADPHGIRRGWFNWPYNFDPVWLVNCDGFSGKEAA